MPRLIIALDMPDAAAGLDPERFTEVIRSAIGENRAGRFGFDKVVAYWADDQLQPEPRPSRWPSETARYAALGRIPRHRWVHVDADLELVDRLEQRLAAMTVHSPTDGLAMSAADVVRGLFEQARHLVIHWHTAEALRELEAAMAPRIITENEIRASSGHPPAGEHAHRMWVDEVGDRPEPPEVTP
jgi:hypothetical protein